LRGRRICEVGRCLDAKHGREYDPVQAQHSIWGVRSPEGDQGRVRGSGHQHKRRRLQGSSCCAVRLETNRSNADIVDVKQVPIGVNEDRCEKQGKEYKYDLCQFRLRKSPHSHSPADEKPHLLRSLSTSTATRVNKKYRECARKYPSRQESSGIKSRQLNRFPT
jgi:hypothetical protein